jgi:hypothetical protein
LLVTPTGMSRFVADRESEFAGFLSYECKGLRGVGQAGVANEMAEAGVCPCGHTSNVSKLIPGCPARRNQLTLNL